MGVCVCVRVRVRVRVRVCVCVFVTLLILQGGAFGGKEYRTFLVTVPAALAAQRSL